MRLNINPLNYCLEKPKNKNLDAIVSDSRRGSLAPPGSSRRGSRQGSISLAGTERRGSYYGDDVSKRATVAVVVNDPNAKSNINKALNGEGKKQKSCFPPVSVFLKLLYYILYIYIYIF